MALVSVAEAARLVGRNRKTLYGTYIKTGRLSCIFGENGEKKIETSELLRMFGHFFEKNEVSEEKGASNVLTGQVKNEQEKDIPLVAKLAALETENI